MPKAKVGVALGSTITVMVIGEPQVPASGVNVYVPVSKLFITAGFQVPVIPLLDVVGNIGAVVPEQNGGIATNVDVKIGFDKMIPVKRFVVQPLIITIKLEYNPLFNPGIVICPAPFATKGAGPITAPSSV